MVIWVKVNKIKYPEIWVKAYMYSNEYLIY